MYNSKKMILIIALCLTTNAIARTVAEEVIAHHKDFVRLIAPRKESPFLIATGIMHPFFNVVNADISDEWVDYVKHVLEEKCRSKLPISWWLPVNANNKKLEELLKKNGFTLLGYFSAWDYCFTDLGNKDLADKLLVHNQLTVAKVENLEQLEIWTSLLQQSMRYTTEALSQYVSCLLPHIFAPHRSITLILAYYEGEAVGTGLAYYKDGAYAMTDLSILPNYRSRGFSEEIVYKVRAMRNPCAHKSLGFASVAGEKVLKSVNCQIHSDIAIYMLL